MLATSRSCPSRVLHQVVQKPDEVRHARLRTLHRDDIDELKVVYVCSKHFREDEVKTTHRVPKDKLSRDTRNRPKLMELYQLYYGEVSYYSTHPSVKRSRFFLENKDGKLLNKAVSLTLESGVSFHNGEHFPIPNVTLCDIRQLELVFSNISALSTACTTSKVIPNSSDNISHIASAESHIQPVIDNMYDSECGDDLIPYPEVSRLQSVHCQF
ncbi:hypothetical protein LOD99_820 [Oopsacas minuta]|uniref:THAP-type domain-containing protein n=1 Tax=Oopsacas minuta TaxID=111878 RepID=A0AAV7K1F8_9METZ|nr:hypothetical protein LOD99_820 [Oopsacas minuta]